MNGALDPVASYCSNRLVMHYSFADKNKGKKKQTTCFENMIKKKEMPSKNVPSTKCKKWGDAWCYIELIWLITIVGSHY